MGVFSDAMIDDERTDERMDGAFSKRSGAEFSGKTTQPPALPLLSNVYE